MQTDGAHLANSLDGDATVNGPAVEGWEIQGGFESLSAGLASLDVKLAERGEQFLFTTTLDDVEIRGSAVSESLLSRLGRLLVVGALLALAVFLYRWCRREGIRTLVSPPAGWALIALGLACLILGSLWLLGLVSILGGIAILIVRLAQGASANRAAA